MIYHGTQKPLETRLPSGKQSPRLNFLILGLLHPSWLSLLRFCLSMFYGLVVSQLTLLSIYLILFYCYQRYPIMNLRRTRLDWSAIFWLSLLRFTYLVLSSSNLEAHANCEDYYQKIKHRVWSWTISYFSNLPLCQFGAVSSGNFNKCSYKAVYLRGYFRIIACRICLCRYDSNKILL